MARISFSVSGPYKLGALYAIGTATLLAVQNPFSAEAAKQLPPYTFIGLTQLALLLSLPLLLSGAGARRDFWRAMTEVLSWLKLLALFAIGTAGLLLYKLGLSDAHPITISALLNLSPFWAALVTRIVVKKPIPLSPLLFFGCGAVAFAGVLTIAWSQSATGHAPSFADFTDDLLHSPAALAIPVPALLALNGTLIGKWYKGYDTFGIVAANFVVSALLIAPASALIAYHESKLQVGPHQLAPILLLLAGTLLSAALGRALYQVALEVTENDNGFVSLFFLLEPAVTCFISLPLSHWITSVHVDLNLLFFGGLALVSVPLFFVCLRLWRSERAPDEAREEAKSVPPRAARETVRG